MAPVPSGGAAVIGREADLDAIVDHLAESRLVSVLGTGGIGKTAVARAVVERLPTRVDWLDLTAMGDGSDAEAVAHRMLATLSVDTWAVTHADALPLVVLDNCEHVLAAASDLAAQLLAAHPGVRVLATSRVELGVDGEIRYRLSPLSTRVAGDAESPAARLFVARSRAAGAAWPDSPPNRSAVRSIVARLDGIPLAIELAAAQAVAISPAELVDLIGPSLDVLTDRTSPDAPHGSLRAVIGASYERLGPARRRCFRAIAPLGFPFDLKLVAAMAELDRVEALDLVNDLVHESLLTVEHRDDGSSSFRLLEPVRQYALERLVESGEEVAVEERFIDAMASFADELVVAVVEHFDLSLLAAAAERFTHIVRAVELTLARDDAPGRAYRLVLPLFAPSSGPRPEVAALGRRIRGRWPDHDDPLRGEALAVIAHNVMVVGDLDEARELAELVLEIPAASPVGRLVAKRTLGSIAAIQDDYATATVWFERAIEDAAAFGGMFEREMRATVLGLRVDGLDSLGELAEIGDLAAAEEDDVTLGWTLGCMANINLQNGRLTEAERCVDRAELVAARSPLRFSTSSIALSRAEHASAAGDWTVAATAWSRCLELMLAWGDVEGLAVALRLAASGAEACGRPDVADRLWRCRPSGRANSILPAPFRAEEQRLLDRCGPPLPVSLSEALEGARAVLTAEQPEVGDDADHQPTVIRFEPGYELDLTRHELRRNGDTVHVEPQVFDLLAHLATNAGRLVTREELMDAVWSTRFVSAAAVSSRIRSARAATGDDGRRQAVIRTVHGRGFEFVAPVT